jgi:nucleoside-diphosphate-sugar epimerase
LKYSITRSLGATLSVTDIDIDSRIAVKGAGGFIGGHVVTHLIHNGFRHVRAIDVKPRHKWYQQFSEAENVQLDLREKDACYAALEDTRWVFNFACNMGGMGFIEHHKTACMLSVLINTHLLMAARDIEIWGDGEQTRSFMYIDDCIEGTLRLMRSDVSEPLNIGSDRLVSINPLVDVIEGIAGVTLKRSYIPNAPQGVRGRNSDNALVRERLGWAPSIPLEIGIERTYRWIYGQMTRGEAP